MILAPLLIVTGIAGFVLPEGSSLIWSTTILARDHSEHHRKEITMTLLTQKFSKQVFVDAIRVVTLVLFVFGVAAALGSFAYVANAGDNTVAAIDEQVPFTATGTGVLNSVMHLPGGLTQVNFSTSGKATHLGDFTGPLTRIEDNHGNFGSTVVIVGANGKDNVFFNVSGRFEGTRGSNKCLVTSTGTYTVTGGAGAFANATGSGTITTQIDQCARTATGTYTGTISKPNSN
jgi:hypothetical protein